MLFKRNPIAVQKIYGIGVEDRSKYVFSLYAVVFFFFIRFCDICHAGFYSVLTRGHFFL